MKPGVINMSSANKHNEEEDDGDIGDQVSSIVDLHLPTLSQINLPELNSSAPESDIDESTVGLSFRRALGLLEIIIITG